MSTYLLRMILPIRKTKILRSPLISTRKTRAKWAWKAFTQLRYCFSAEIISVLISSRAPVFGRKSLVFLRSWSAAKKSSQHSNASFREIRISESKMYSEKRTFRSLAILPSHSAFASVGSSEVELVFLIPTLFEFEFQCEKSSPWRCQTEQLQKSAQIRSGGSRESVTKSDRFSGRAGWLPSRKRRCLQMERVQLLTCSSAQQWSQVD